MTTAARQVHQLHVLRDSKEANLFDLFAVLSREPQNFTRSSRTTVTRGVYTVEFGAIEIPVNLATVAGLGPGVLSQVPHACFAHRTAERNREVLAIRTHVRFLQNHASLLECFFAIKHERFLFAREIHRKDLAGTAKHDGLAIRAPSAPSRIFDNLRFVRTVNTDSPQIPLFWVVCIIFRNPASLATVKKHLRAIRSNAREPVHIVALGKRTGVRSVRIHNPNIVERIRTARRPDNSPFELTLQGIESLLFFRSRIHRCTHRSALCSKSRCGQKANRRNQHKLFHNHT